MQGNLEEIFIRCYCAVSVNLSMCIVSISMRKKMRCLETSIVIWNGFMFRKFSIRPVN